LGVLEQNRLCALATGLGYRFWSSAAQTQIIKKTAVGVQSRDIVVNNFTISALG